MSLDDEMAALKDEIAGYVQERKISDNADEKKSLDLKIHDCREIYKLLLQQKGILGHVVLLLSCLNSMYCFVAYSRTVYI